MREQPEPGERLYSAHLDRWVRHLADPDDDGRAAVHVEGLDGSVTTAVVFTSGLFPSDHYPAQIGTHDEDGSRTHRTPGEVCAGCSDEAAGRWVPVNECPIAWDIYERNEATAGFGAWLWLT